MTTDPAPTVGRAWRRTFLVEIPLSVGTALYWLVAPGDYVRRAFGVAAADVAHGCVLRQLAGVLVSLLGWTYGRWLLSGTVETRPFRYLQEGFALGDVFLFGGGLIALLRREMSPALAVGQMVPALAWLAVRAVFLWRTRPILHLPLIDDLPPVGSQEIARNRGDIGASVTRV